MDRPEEKGVRKQVKRRRLLVAFASVADYAPEAHAVPRARSYYNLGECGTCRHFAVDQAKAPHNDDDDNNNNNGHYHLARYRRRLRAVVIASAK